MVQRWTSQVQESLDVLCIFVAVSNPEEQEKFILVLNQSTQIQKCISVSPMLIFFLRKICKTSPLST